MSSTQELPDSHTSNTEVKTNAADAVTTAAAAAAAAVANAVAENATAADVVVAAAQHNINNNVINDEETPSTSSSRTTDGPNANNNTNGGDRLSPEHDIFINPADGLPSQHPTLHNNASDSDYDCNAEEHDVDPDTFDDLPTSIIVTNIHSEVFMDPKLKLAMETLFRTFSPSATFQWLRSFRRLRVNYDNAIAASKARINLHQYKFNTKTTITCYFAQPVTPVSNKNLQPPAPVKQFLISPPASPPAGWEPREENEPLVNHDLLAALASLTPGESHELHPQSEDQPAIVVHTAMMPEGGIGAVAPNNTPRQQIVPTKCPDRT